MKNKLTDPPRIEGEPIKTAFGKLMPGFEDKIETGEKITTSHMTMGAHAGVATVEHEGKSHKITVCQNFGASITLIAEHRSFHLDLEALIDHAVEAGLVDKQVTFKAKKGTK